MSAFLEQLHNTIIKQQLVKENEKVLIGVSGGPDSIALLHGLHTLIQTSQMNGRLFVVHVNHLLRGKESDHDADYVARLCQQLGISCTICEVDVLAQLQKEGGNQQAVARQLRYEAFYQTAQKFGISKVALAHHADDQVETVLMRIIRGTSVSGLSGMQPMRTWRNLQIIRPLLHIFRHEIEDYIDQVDVPPPRQDTSNLSTLYTRNRIRLELLPELQSYNKQVKSKLLQLSEIASAEEQVWSELTKQALEEMILDQNEANYQLDVKKFIDLPVALQRRTVKLILDCLIKNSSNEITLEAIDKVRKCATHKNPTTELHISGGIRIKKEYEHLLFTYLVEQRTMKPYPVKTQLMIPGITKLFYFHGEIETFITDRLLDEVQQNQEQVVFDLEQLNEPLFVRSRRAGDRISYFGLNGSKKVKKLFMESKIPKSRRDQYPIVVMGEQIIWIPGIRRSDIAPVTSKTKKFLYLIWRQKS